MKLYAGIMFLLINGVVISAEKDSKIYTLLPGGLTVETGRYQYSGVRLDGDGNLRWDDAVRADKWGGSSPQRTELAAREAEVASKSADGKSAKGD